MIQGNLKVIAQGVADGMARSLAQSSATKNDYMDTVRDLNMLIWNHFDGAWERLYDEDYDGE